MRNARRIALVGGGILAVVLLVSFISTRIYLSSNHAKQQVGDKLSATLGARVVVDDLSVGASSVSFQMEVFEGAGGAVDAPPLLTVERIEADVTPLQLLSGDVAPQHVTLRGAKLKLSYDRDGKLLTRLPEPQGDSGGALPEIKLSDSSLTLTRAGRPDFHLSGLSATLRPDGDRLILDGTVADPFWKQWTVKGVITQAEGAFALTLENAGMHVTQLHLNTLPYVPDGTWEQVQADGHTPIHLKLEKAAGGALQYRVAMKPERGVVHLGAIDLTTTDTSGEVVIDGERIEIKGGKGKTAGGELAVDAVLDFALTPARLQFKVDARQLNIQKLPKKWALPEDLEGDLKGSAELELLLKDGEFVSRGQGKGVLENAKVAGFAADPIEIELRPSGTGFKFNSNGKSSRREAGPGPLDLLALAVVTLYQPDVGPQKPDAEAPYVDARLRLKDVDVQELFARLKVELPLKVQARATADLTLSIPVTAPRTTKAYRARGTLTVPKLKLEGLELDDVVAELTLRDGVLTLDKFTAKPQAAEGKPGTLEGTARVEVEPRGELTATLKLTDVPVAEALNSIPGLKLTGTGRVSGDATFRAPVEKVTDPAVWVASTKLSADKLELQGRRVEDVRLEARVEKGTAKLTTATAKIEKVPVKATGALGLVEPYRFEASVDTTAADGFALRRLLPELELPVAISGKLESASKLEGTLSPFALKAGGTATITDARIAEAEVARAAFRWDLTQERLRLTDVEAKVYDGTISGKADIPLVDRAKGDFAIAFKGVDATALAKAVPDAPITLEGAVDGKLTGTLPAVEKGQPRKASADLDLSAPKLKLQGIPTERVTGKLRYAPQAIEYELKGDVLGGGFELEGKYPLDSSKLPRPKQGSQHFDLKPFPLEEAYQTAGLQEVIVLQPRRDAGGSFRLTGVDLGRLARALGSPYLEPLGGRVDASLEYAHDVEGGLSGRGRVSVRRLGWGGKTLAPELTGVLRLNDDLLELTDVAGLVAGGTVRGRVRYNRAQPQRSFFNVLVERADPAVLLAPWPDLADIVKGPTSLHLRGQIGRAWRGTGAVEVARGEVGGLTAANLRVPFDWALSPGRGGQLTAREPSGRLVGGQVVGRATYEWWPGGSRAEGDVRFGGIDLSALEINQLKGRVKGRFTFSGSDVRSVNDITGLLTATFGDFSPRQTPVMTRLIPHLGAGESITPFRSGELRARLARGALRVERLELVSPGAQIFAEGTVTLTGRLDMQVLANTGQVGPDNRVLLLLARRIPSAGSVPLTVLMEVNEFLSNRLIRLDVTGTVAQPVVRVNKAALLKDEAARFFTQRVREKVASPLDLLVP